MAKASEFGSLVHFGRIMWDKRWNFARDGQEYGDAKDLKASITTHGWSQTPDGTIEIEPIKEAPEPVNTDVKLADLVKEEEKRRKEWHDSLKILAKTSKDKEKELEVFERVYCQDGKLEKIEYIGTSGNRRASVYFVSMLARANMNPPQPVTDMIPCIVRHYENARQRLETQIEENDRKTTGFLEMSNTARLKAAKWLVGRGATQSDLRKTFRDGNGQKLWGVLQLNAMWPEVKIYERMLKDPNDPDHIKFGSQSTGDLTLYMDRSDPKRLAERNAIERKNGRQEMAPATAEEIDTFFRTAKSTNKDKVMDGETIRTLASHCPVLIIRDAFKGAAEKDKDRFTHYEAFEKELNAIHTLIKDGDFPLLSKVILNFVQTPESQRKEVHDRLLKVFEPRGNVSAGSVTRETASVK
jgi:hypothetical protein